jgi:hypothetical protein
MDQDTKPLSRRDIVLYAAGLCAVGASFPATKAIAKLFQNNKKSAACGELPGSIDQILNCPDQTPGEAGEAIAVRQNGIKRALAVLGR